MKAVVQGVIKTLMTSAEITRSALGWIVSFKNLLNGVTDSEVGPVHMTGNHKNAANRKMVMGNISQPQGFSLRMEATKESENRSS